MNIRRLLNIFVPAGKWMQLRACIRRKWSTQGSLLGPQLFLNIMNEKIRKTDGHYEVPLPFRHDKPVIPNNLHIDHLSVTYVVVVPRLLRGFGGRINESESVNTAKQSKKQC